MAQTQWIIQFISRNVSGNSYLVKRLSGENFYNERKEDEKQTLFDKGLQSLKQNTNCSKRQSSLDSWDKFDFRKYI